METPPEVDKEEVIKNLISNLPSSINAEEKKAVKKAMQALSSTIFADPNPSDPLRNRLEILIDYERHYLGLIKEYKEEIKFCNAVQDDLRRERAQFFSQSLKTASETLKETGVDPEVSSKWLQELVESHTRSLDLSGDLARSYAVDILGQIRQEALKNASAPGGDSGHAETDKPA